MKPPRRLPPRLAAILDAGAALSELLPGKKFRTPDDGFEAPKVVIDEFVALLVAELGARTEGVKFVKSKREIQIRRGDLTFGHQFQGNRHNATGVSINFWPHASVSSDQLKTWRKNSPAADKYFGPQAMNWNSDPSTFIFGMYGNFFFPHDYVEIRLIDPKKRPRELDRLLKYLLAIDQSLQNCLSDQEKFIDYAASPKYDIVCRANYACQYISARWGLEAVNNYIDQVMRRHKGHASLNQYREEMESKWRTSLPINR